MNPKHKRALAQVAPYGLVRLRQRRAFRERERLARELAGRSRDATSSAYSPEAALEFLVGRGLAEQTVRDGSMPFASLAFAAGVLREHLARGRALVGLHVGNFVGMSLVHVTALLRELHPDSVMVSVDPDVEHRGVEHPMGHALALLGRFGLADRSVVVTGYTLEQNLADSGEDDALARWRREAACEQVLPNLARLCGRRFDLLILDGNHEGSYPRREFAVAQDLLADGALAVFDDIAPGTWEDVIAAFEDAAADPAGRYEQLGVDGRVGVLRRRAEVAQAPVRPQGS